MTPPRQPQFAIRLAGPDGVETLYLATAFASFPTGAAVPADASAALKASIGRIEDLLGDKTIVMLDADASFPEGQMIEGQMIERQLFQGQMIENRDDD